MLALRRHALLAAALCLCPPVALAQPAPAPATLAVPPSPAPTAPTPATATPPATRPPARPAARPRSSWSAFPLIAYSRETDVMLGGFGVYYFRLGDAPVESRPSYVAAGAMYTTRNQALVDVFPELWFDRERWVVTGQFGYRRFPDSYFGLGNDTRTADEERYLFHSFFDRMELRRRLLGPLFAGLRQEFQVHEVLDVGTNGLLATAPPLGAEGGIRSGGGPTLVWDSRDNTLAPHFGLYYQMALLTFQPFLGSDYRYTRFNLDARHYVTFGERHTIAVQYYLDLNGGDVPFHALAQIGGAVRLRGYFEGRFRDKNYLMAQVEYRLMPLIWRFGLVAFAAVGQVAPSLGDLTFEGTHWTVGGGVRFSINPEERIHLRADVGVGPDSWGLYINVLEAF